MPAWYAPKASPAFTGAPTAVTAALGTATGQLATTLFVKNEIDALKGGASAALDTLKEFEDALANENSAIAALTGVVATKQDISTRGLLTGFRDKMINGNGRINQRGVTSVTDDKYAWDRCNVLTQSAPVGIGSLTAVAPGRGWMMKMTQTAATAQRMAFSQIFEAADVLDWRGQVMTLCGTLLYSNAAAIRYAILEWTGTADVVTSDVVNDWTSGNFSAGNFFLGSNLVVNQIGTITPAANALTDFALKATIGNTANNVIVLTWTEAPAAQGSTLALDWHFVVGDATAETRPVGPRPAAIEELLCYRYFQKTFPIDVAPAHNQGSNYGSLIIFDVGGNTAGNQYGVMAAWRLIGSMRATPSVTKYSVNPTTAPNGNVNDVVNSSVSTEWGCSAVAKKDSVVFQLSATLTNQGNPLGVYATVDAEL